MSFVHPSSIKSILWNIKNILLQLGSNKVLHKSAIFRAIRPFVSIVFRMFCSFVLKVKHRLCREGGKKNSTVYRLMWMLLLRAQLLEQARAHRSHQVDLRHIFSISYLQTLKANLLSRGKYALFCGAINGPLERVNSGELSQAILNILSALSTQPVHSPEVAQPNYKKNPSQSQTGRKLF